ncbi:MAG TPA: hypothetical protein VE861_04805 [Gemmatimonadaceae bacterium]|nr:hypothetical protein [Gemmatimonadaceae bacterium]
MSKYAFDTALAARRSATLAGAMTYLSPFVELCRHSVQRGAFPRETLAWSASREPLAMSVLYRGEPVWSVMAAGETGRWLVSQHGTAVSMSLQEALLDQAHALASTATMSDRVRFEWRGDGTIGGTF